MYSPDVMTFRTTGWPPGVVLPEPYLDARSDVIEDEQGRRMQWKTEWSSFDPPLEKLPPDFALREVLEVDPDVEDDVWKWSNLYGAPAWLDPWPRDGYPTSTMQDQARALRGAQQAAGYVLASSLDDPDAPEPYNTDDYLQHLPEGPHPWRSPRWEAFYWLKPRLAHWAPLVITSPEQEDVELNYAHWDEIVAAQLYNLASQRPTMQKCANAPWHRKQTPWFTVQRTDSKRRTGHGSPHGAGHVRFCSRACAKAYTERERRRRLREQKESN